MKLDLLSELSNVILEIKETLKDRDVSENTFTMDVFEEHVTFNLDKDATHLLNELEKIKWNRDGFTVTFDVRS